jgi:N-acetylneuraminate synthase/N,N'-diacetyllegionaminate synthase
MNKIRIGNRNIGNNQLIFIIAEAGVNHNGSVELAKELINCALDAGADAVKFQTYNVDKLVVKGISDNAESQYDMLKRLELKKDDFRVLSKYSNEKGIIFLSTPFDEESVDFLAELGVPAYKIGSGDITNLQLLEYIANKGRPMIISTGMSTLNEIQEAVDVVQNSGNKEIILLHCVSNYPVEIQNCNLNAIKTLKENFNLPVGYSDHSEGITASILAVGLGACVIEKHFTTDKNLAGPDHKASLNPRELKDMVAQIRIAEKMLGTKIKIPIESEMDILKIARKSIVAKVNIKKGTKFSHDMLTIKRPGTGLAPKFLSSIIGKTAKTDIVKDEIITADKIQEKVN